MKKKLFLLPLIALMVTTVTGCFDFLRYRSTEVAPVYIDEWLAAVKDPREDPNCGKFYYKNEEETAVRYDYGLKVRNMMQAIDFGHGTKIKEEIKDKTEPFIGYNFYANVGKLDYCRIKVFSDGIVTTSAFGATGKLSPTICQLFEYSIDSSIAEAFVNSAIARYNEIKEGIAQERETAREESTLDKFIADIEQAENSPTALYTETRQGFDYIDYSVVDYDRTILNQLKELELTPMNDDYSIDLIPMIEYYIKSDWKFQLYSGWGKADYNLVSMSYRIKDSEYKAYYGNYYEFFFSIDKSKGEAIANSVRALHE